MPANLNKISTIIKQVGAVAPEKLFTAFCIDYLAQKRTSIFHTVPLDHQEAALAFIRNPADITSFLNNYFSTQQLDAGGEFAKLLQMFLICHPEYSQYLKKEIKDNLPRIQPDQGDRKEIINLVQGLEANWTSYFIRILEKMKILKMKSSFINIDASTIEILATPKSFEVILDETKLKVLEEIFKKTKSRSSTTRRRAFEGLSKIFKLIPVEDNALAADSALNSKLRNMKNKIANAFFFNINAEDEIDASIVFSSTEGFDSSYSSLPADQKNIILKKLSDTVAVALDGAKWSYLLAVNEKKICINMLANIANSATKEISQEIFNLLFTVIQKKFECDATLAIHELFSKPSLLTAGKEAQIIKMLLDIVRLKDHEHSEEENIQAALKTLANLFLRIQIRDVNAAEEKEENLHALIYKTLIENLAEPYTVAAMEALTVIYNADFAIVDKMEVTYIFINMLEHSEETVREAAIRNLMTLQNLIPESCKSRMHETLAKLLRDDASWSIKSIAFLALNQFSSFPKQMDPKVTAALLIDDGIKLLNAIKVERKWEVAEDKAEVNTEENAQEDIHEISDHIKALIQNLAAIGRLEWLEETEKSKIFQTCLNYAGARLSIDVGMEIKDILCQLVTSPEEKKQLIDFLKIDLANETDSDVYRQLMIILRKFTIHAQKNVKLMVAELLIENLSVSRRLRHSAFKDTVFALTSAMDQSQKNYIIFGILLPKINSIKDPSINAHLTHVLCEICEEQLIARNLTADLEGAFKQLEKDTGTANNDGCQDVLTLINAYRF